MEQYDVDALIYPTTKNEISKLSNVYVNSGPSYFISPATGFPSLAIPMGFDQKGFPYGMEVLALDNNEELLYKVAYPLEDEYVLPSASPALYTVTDEVEILIESYIKYTDLTNYTESSVKQYNETREEIEAFF